MWCISVVPEHHNYTALYLVTAITILNTAAKVISDIRPALTDSSLIIISHDVKLAGGRVAGTSVSVSVRQYGSSVTALCQSVRTEWRV